MSKESELYQAVSAEINEDNDKPIDEITDKDLIIKINAHEEHVKSLIKLPELEDLFNQKEKRDRLLYNAGAENNHIKMVDLLLTNMKPLEHFANQTMAYACQKGHAEVVELLLTHNAFDADLIQEDITILPNACLSGNIQLINKLLKYAPNLNTEVGTLSLNNACRIGDLDTVKLLIAKGAKVKGFNELDENPFFHAATNNHAHILSYLLENNQVDDFNKLSPFIYRSTNPEMLDILRNRNNSEENILHNICYYNNLSLLKAMPEIDISLTRANRAYPIHYTAEHGLIELFKHLLERGVDVKRKDQHDKTPLHFACIGRQLNIIQFLLNRKTPDDETPIDIDARCIAGDTPLTAMLQLGQADDRLLEAVKLLLACGADCNAINSYGRSPLILAAQKNSVELTEELIKFGADINQSGAYLLEYAAANNSIEVIKLLVSHPDIDIYGLTYHNKTAAEHPLAKPETKQLLLDYQYQLKEGDDVNQITREGNTRLCLAAQIGYIDIANSLLASGAKVNLANIEGLTPLHLAISGKHETMAFRLLDAGADINAVSNDGLTPLHLAISAKHETIALRLLDAGADINAVSNDGLTPLHLALSSKDETIALRLLDAGANVNQVDHNGKTLLGIALSNHFDDIKLSRRSRENIAPPHRFKDIALRLMDSGAMLNQETHHCILYDAIRYEDTNFAVRLLEVGVDMQKTSGNYKQTVLDLAINKKLIPLALHLLDLGADINKSYDDANITPLFTAIDEGHESFALTLLDRGADVNKHNNEYTIPLISAIEKGYINIVARLLELGADTTVTNSEGLTIIQLAQGNDAILGLLQDHEERLSQESSSGRRPS